MVVSEVRFILIPTGIKILTTSTRNTMSSLKESPAEPLAVIASDDADYDRLGLSRDAVAPWEDGARTDNRRGTYEWWYFDALLNDGSSLVVVFMNKGNAAANGPLAPTIRID